MQAPRRRKKKIVVERGGSGRYSAEVKGKRKINSPCWGS